MKIYHRAEKAENKEEAIVMLKEQKNIISSQKKGILLVALFQVKFFKLFKESEALMEMIKELSISQSTVYF